MNEERGQGEELARLVPEADMSVAGSYTFDGKDSVANHFPGFLIDSHSQNGQVWKYYLKIK